jgi:hypothetical protein
MEYADVAEQHCPYSRAMERTMAIPIQLTLTADQMAHFLEWRADVEAETGTPLEGVVLSVLLTRHGHRQILVRPSTEQDFKLKDTARLDGTYDNLMPYEEVLAEYDNFGFASTPLHWHDVGITLHLCYGPLLEQGDTPRCYVECVHDPHQPFVPFRVSAQPELMEEDALLQVFPSTPLPPAVTQRIQEFIRTNVAVLLQHWHGEIGSAALLAALQPPEGAEETAAPPGREAQ